MLQCRVRECDETAVRKKRERKKRGITLIFFFGYSAGQGKFLGELSELDLIKADKFSKERRDEERMRTRMRGDYDLFFLCGNGMDYDFLLRFS